MVRFDVFDFIAFVRSTCNEAYVDQFNKLEKLKTETLLFIFWQINKKKITTTSDETKDRETTSAVCYPTRAVHPAATKTLTTKSVADPTAAAAYLEMVNHLPHSLTVIAC